MPRSAAPPWKQRKQPVLDHLVLESVSQAGGKPDAEGKYRELHYTGIDSRERADEIKRALYRAKRYVGHSVHARVERTGSTYRVVFFAVDPVKAKAYMLRTYGTDRTKWPYSPMRGDPNFDTGGNQ